MTPPTPLSLETVFGIVVSLLIAALWHWVKGVAEGQKSIEREIEKLLNKVHEVEKNYQSRSDAKEEKNAIMQLLKEIKNDLKEVSSKLDRKVDK